MVLMLHLQGSVLTTGVALVGVVVVHACVASRAASLTGAVPSCVNGACTTSSIITRRQQRYACHQTCPRSAVWAEHRSQGVQTLPAQPGNLEACLAEGVPGAHMLLLAAAAAMAAGASDSWAASKAEGA